MTKIEPPVFSLLPANTIPIDPLMRTKFYLPRVSSDIVPRGWLLERLQSGLDGKITLVCAPAGFGKTTLLVEWLKSSARSTAWLSLDERDNEVAHETVSALEEVTEGWIALLRLVTLSLHRDVDHATFIEQLRHFPEKYVSGFLVEEILSQQAPAVQALLLRMLEHSSAEERDTLHHRASAWYVERGFIEEALGHVLEVGDTLYAAHLVEAQFLPLREHEHWMLMERWLHLLPEDRIQSSPTLLCGTLWIYTTHARRSRS